MVCILPKKYRQKASIDLATNRHRQRLYRLQALMEHISNRYLYSFDESLSLLLPKDRFSSLIFCPDLTRDRIVIFAFRLTTIVIAISLLAAFVGSVRRFCWPVFPQILPLLRAFAQKEYYCSTSTSSSLLRHFAGDWRGFNLIARRSKAEVWLYWLYITRE